MCLIGCGLEIHALGSRIGSAARNDGTGRNLPRSIKAQSRIIPLSSERAIYFSKFWIVFTPTIRRIRQGQENGTIREGDPGALAVAYWCAIQGIAEELAAKPEMPCQESSWIIDIIRRHES